MMHRVLLAVALLLTAPMVGRAADWPMWRCGPERGAATAEELPARLHLQWVRELPVLRPAWEGDPKKPFFDNAYHPIAVGELLIVGSSRNDSVTAYDAATGARKWRFYADGPVRFAPAAWKGRLFVASDDGHLYCLEASTGKLLWKFRGGPSGRRVLGNERLISSWPVRGGPAVAGGRVYFAAGIWPFMGVFVYALDAESGKVLWRNDSSGFYFQQGKKRFSGGSAPQGYLAVSGDRLVVPNNRIGPAVFEIKTGKFLLARGSYSGGNWSVAATAGCYFSGRYAARLDSFARLYMKNGRPFYPSGLPIFTGETLYASDGRKITAYDLKRTRFIEGKKRGVATLEAPTSWTFAHRGHPWLKAGRRLYVTQRKSLVAVDIPAGGGGGKVSWQTPVEGTVGSMLAAGGRLFVVTLEGRIRCFGGAKVAVRKYPREGKVSRTAPGAGGRAAGMLKTAGVSDGYCVVLGVGDGKLVEELARREKLYVIAVDLDAKKVDALRRRLDAAGLYGTRATVHVADPARFELPPYLANLIVSGDIKNKTSVEKIFRALRPYGGTACLPAAAKSKLAAWVREAKAAGVEVKIAGGYALMVRAGGPAGAAEWTHQWGSAGNTMASNDSLVRAPLGVLWFGGPSSMKVIDRHHMPPSPPVVRGRMFLQTRDAFCAVDIYTGRVLWEASLPGVGGRYAGGLYGASARLAGCNYAATFDVLYVVHEGKLLKLDPASGEKTGEFKPPGGEAGEKFWAVRTWKDLLITTLDPLSFGPKPTRKVKSPLGFWNQSCSRRLAGLDRKSGKLLWSRKAENGFRHTAVAVGGGKVFGIDMHPPATGRKGTPKLLVLNARTGKVLWSKTENVYGTWLGYSEKHDVLIQSQGFGGAYYKAEAAGRIIAYRGKDGSVLWDQKIGGGPPVISGDWIITGGAHHLLTGKPRLFRNPLTGREGRWSYAGKTNCGFTLASRHLLTFRSSSAGYFDLKGNSGFGKLDGIRSGCTNSLIPAGGVLSAPNFAIGCACPYPMHTAAAFVHMPENEMWTKLPGTTWLNNITHLAVNLGAPGDRRAPDGTVWLAPRLRTHSADVKVKVEPVTAERFCLHTSRLEGKGLKWVAASGLKGVTALVFPRLRANAAYAVRLHFSEPDDLKPGARVFSVALQGKTVLTNFDVIKAASGPRRPLVKEFKGVRIDAKGTLRVEFKASKGTPVICGVEITAK
jgi:outer membrane protein assembly factor BamB